MKKASLFLVTLSLVSSPIHCEDYDDSHSLAQKLWQELEASKLPKSESEVQIKEELGPSDLAFLEDQLPTPQKETKEVIASDFDSLEAETDEVSLGQAAPIRKNSRQADGPGKTYIRKREDRNLFRERSRGEEVYNPTEFNPPKMRKRSH